VITPKVQLQLEDGAELRGRFWIAGQEETHAAGILRWSKTGGAEVRLIGPFQGWPVLAGQPDDLDVHGISIEGGTGISLPRPLVSQSGIGATAFMTLKDPTLVLEVNLEPDQTWKKLILRTTHLHEWLPTTGFQDFVLQVTGRAGAS
jgi:hypothetical protein